MSQTEELIQVGAAEFIVKLAECEEEVYKAMRLRYEVFVEEEDNRFLMNPLRLEQDRYDPFCDHLIVQEVGTGQVVGTYRLLPGKRADEGIGFYSESEFDLSGLCTITGQTLELGRSCVAPAYRNGKVIELLWEGIALYIDQHRYDYMIGCASIHVSDLQQLNEIYTLLRNKGMITDRFEVKPLESHRIEGLELLDDLPNEKKVFRGLPPLIKGYQRLGAEIGGAPAYDPFFKTVDFLIILERSKVTKRYKRHFMPV